MKLNGYLTEIMRNFLIFSGLLAALALAQPAVAQELKLATLAPDGSSWMNSLRAAAAEVEKRSDGQVRIRYYPGGVMGDASTVMRRMRLGQLHGGAFTLGDLEGVARETNLYSVPFLFAGEAELQAVREEFDEIILEALERGGLVVPAIANGGFAYLFSRQPIPATNQVSADFRVWIPEGDRLSRRTLEAAGASAVPLKMAEVYTGLQTGTINTFASTPAGAIILQWHSRARYMLDLPVLLTAGTVALDRRAHQRLSTAHQALFTEVFGRVLGELEAVSREENIQARKALVSQGIEIVAPTPEQARAWQAISDRELDRLIASGQLEIPGLDRLRRRLAESRAENGPG